MARLTYSAPGVYVEEIPSAQQPIAGVGTSTAAFIGVVPDSIKYPVRNEKYNPRAAQIDFKIKALGGADLKDGTDEEKKQFLLDKTYLQTQIEKWESTLPDVAAGDSKKLDEELKKADKAVTDAQSEFDQAKDAASIKDPTDPTKETAKDKENKRKMVDKEKLLNQAKEAKNTAKEAVDNAQEALNKATAVPEVLVPYVLKTFVVKDQVDPYVAKLCTNFTEYTNYFGPFSTDDGENLGHRDLTHAVYGFFRNGGMRCFVVRVNSPLSGEIDKALDTIDTIDEVAIITAPGLAGKALWEPLVTHCTNLEDRFAILDSHEEVPPKVEGKDIKLDTQLLTYDAPAESDYLPAPTKNAAFYFPWIEVMDPAQQLLDQDLARKIEAKYQGRVYVPPSGHIAGIYARTDVERGVHKAPANCAIAGAINVKYYLGKGHQEGLNPQGVNCIRNINGNIAVWGARTIGGDHNLEWKYINVRRVMLFLRESIDEGTQWVVFEPNDISLWGKIKRYVSAFLTIVWRSGALFGATPEEAFYVKCDAELNPPEVRDLGQVVTEIGVAIVRPAEFVIFRISQSTGAKV
jgi:phage tail sheath protein FI